MWNGLQWSTTCKKLWNLHPLVRLPRNKWAVWGKVPQRWNPKPEQNLRRVFLLLWTESTTKSMGTLFYCATRKANQLIGWFSTMYIDLDYSFPHWISLQFFHVWVYLGSYFFSVWWLKCMNVFKSVSSSHTCKKVGRLQGCVSQHLTIKSCRGTGQYSCGKCGLTPCKIVDKRSVLWNSGNGYGYSPVRSSAQVMP